MTSTAPPWHPAEASTLFDLVARRAAAAPDGVYLSLYGHPLTAERPGGEPAPAALPRPGEDDVCLLQYTSGSTAAPRGVMLSHGNVMATVRMMVETVAITAADTIVSWLPLYHDMGLIGIAFGSL